MQRSRATKSRGACASCRAAASPTTPFASSCHPTTPSRRCLPARLARKGGEGNGTGTGTGDREVARQRRRSGIGRSVSRRRRIPAAADGARALRGGRGAGARRAVRAAQAAAAGEDRRAVVGGGGQEAPRIVRRGARPRRAGGSAPTHADGNSRAAGEV